MLKEISSKLNKYYKQNISIYERGGLVLKTTRRRVLNGIFLFFLFFGILELSYLLKPELITPVVDHLPWFFVILFLLGFYYLIFDPIFDLYNSYHELGLKQVVSIQGVILSLKKKEHLIPYDLVVGAEVEQKGFGRLLDYGDLIIGTSMRGKAELRIKNIDSPQSVMNELNRLRSFSSKNLDSLYGGGV